MTYSNVAPPLYSSTPAIARPQSLVLESCKGHTGHSRLKLAAMKATVRKYGSSGAGRVGVFGTLVGWVHEQSYVPQVRTCLLLRGHNGPGPACFLPVLSQ